MTTRPKTVMLMWHYLRKLSAVLHWNTLLFLHNSTCCINMTGALIGHKLPSRSLRIDLLNRFCYFIKLSENYYSCSKLLSKFIVENLANSKNIRMLVSDNHPNIFTRWTHTFFPYNSLIFCKYTDVPSEVWVRSFSVLVCLILTWSWLK